MRPSGGRRTPAPGGVAASAGAGPPSGPCEPRAGLGCGGQHAKPPAPAERTARTPTLCLPAVLCWRDEAANRDGRADPFPRPSGSPLRNPHMASRKSNRKRTPSTKSKQYWSADVTRRSDALDLQRGVFTWSDPGRIARSLRRSAERSSRRKGTPFQSAMSMLNFYVNRGGSNLSARQRTTLEHAKVELRKLYGRI